MISHYSIHNVRAVLPDAIMDDATVVVEDGLVVDVRENGARASWSVDGRGAYCLPGLVDCHSDGLEKERSPRPNVSFPHEFALRSYEGRVRAAGVATMFHGVRYEGADNRDSMTVPLANEIVDVLIDRRADTDALVDHRVLYRLDARDGEGCVSLLDRLSDQRVPVDPLPLVSFEDHTPGQGQYRDVEHYRRWMAGTGKYRPEEVDDALQEWIDRRAALEGNRARNLETLIPAVAAGRIRLMTHDPVDAADIAEALRWGASIAEFPTTRDAAVAAREAGLPTVMGAPNVLRGGSHSGNVSAEELVRDDLVTALASDYQPSAMLAAAFLLAARGACSLPRAVLLVSGGPARMVGALDRGRIEPGLRADLLLASHDGRWPTVREVYRAVDPVLVEV